MEGVLVLAGLALLAVPVLLVVALVAIGGLKRRVAALEAALAMRDPAVARESRSAATPVPVTAPAPAPVPVPATPRPPARHGAVAAATSAPPPAPTPAPSAVLHAPAVGRADAPAEGAVAGFLRRARGWFTTGNVPVKIGMVVLFAGVAALLDYATDQGWLQLSLAWRLAGVALAGTVALGVGWRQRHRRPAFARALQGGAVGILLLVAFAASRGYGLVPTGAAFAASAALVALLCVLAVVQGARSLAVLGILAGFLAPLWLSTGSGDHVVLFSYYALLNLGIVAIAWRRPWRELLLLGFVFTWGIGVAWGVLAYVPALRASVQPFLLLFFALYVAMPLLQARRRGPRDVDRVDGTLLFGTPLVALSLQAALLDGARLPLAACAVGIAALYALLAWTLAPRPRYASLASAHAVLAAGFATLAVPLALSAQATAAVFAVEGVALCWLRLRQRRALPQWSGAALQLAAAAAFGIGGAGAVVAADLPPFLHARFVGGLLVALAGAGSAWLYRRHAVHGVAAAFFCWALAWWCGNVLHELARVAPLALRADLQLAFAAVTGWLLAEVHRRAPARGLLLATAAAHAAAIPLAFAQAAAHGQPFAGAGWVAWALFLLLGLRGLAWIDAAARDRQPGGAVAAGEGVASLVPLAWWLAWPVALSLLGHWWVVGHGDGWHWAAVAAPWLLLAWLVQAQWPWLARAGGDAAPLRDRLSTTVMAVLAAGWLVALGAPGDSAPLPWLPVLNPLELAQGAALLLAARWLRGDDGASRWQRGDAAVLGAALLALATTATLRAVHQLGGAPWDLALAATAQAQAALTVVWSVLGVGGWILGSRRGRRGLWLAGAVLMAVVLAKLVLVDRQHLGNLAGIGSFLAYGLLCTLVGWFAPAPPRARDPDACGTTPGPA